MYSNRHLRFLVAVLLVLGLIPTVLLGVQTGDSAHHSMLFFAAVRALIIGGVFAILGYFIGVLIWRFRGKGGG